MQAQRPQRGGDGVAVEEKIELGYTMPREEWMASAKRLQELGEMLCGAVAAYNPGKDGERAAEQLQVDVILAVTAMQYVAVAAVDKCRFVPIRDIPVEQKDT